MNNLKKVFVTILLSQNFLIAQHQNNIQLIENEYKIYSIKKDEPKVFSLQLQKGKKYQIHLEQKGIDVDLILSDTLGNTISFMDSPNGMYGPEIIHFDSQDISNYLLKISALGELENSIKGKFSLEVVEEPIWDNNRSVITTLTPKQMQKDLEIFRNIREKANSGFYRYRTKSEMDSIYAWAYKQLNDTLVITEFYKIILTLSDFEGSCHNETTLPYDLIHYLPKEKGYFPYYLTNIEGKMIVNNVGGIIPLGSRILKINGIPDSILMSRFYKYRTTDGYNMTVKQKSSIDHSYGWRFPFEFGVYDSFTIDYQKPYSDMVEIETVKSISLDEKSESYKKRHSSIFENTIDPNIQEKYSYQRIDSTTALLNFRIFDMSGNDEDPLYKVFCDFLDSVFTQISQEHISNLIIDIRNNPGGSGSNSEKTFTYLAEKPFRENTLAYINYNKVPYAEYYKWNSLDKKNQKREEKQNNQDLKNTYPIEISEHKYLQDQKLNPYYFPDSNRFMGNLYLLIDETVASAASHFASYVRGHTTAKIIGVETTGGYYGHNGHTPVEYVLPNSKISTRFSIVFVEQDAPSMDSQPIGRGIIPDYKVARSLEDFMNNEDTQMKFVLDLIHKLK